MGRAAVKRPPKVRHGVGGVAVFGDDSEEGFLVLAVLLERATVVARDDRWGRTYESYSENPELVASYAPYILQGIQGEPGAADFLRGEHMLATVKHFLGDGGTVGARQSKPARELARRPKEADDSATNNQQPRQSKASVAMPLRATYSGSLPILRRASSIAARR